MFDENGVWKEFGFSGPNHTWFPFWLFCIIWAIVSYASVNFFLGENTSVSIVSNSKNSVRKRGNSVVEIQHEVEVMKPGYYALDKETTTKEGFPKYVYLGPKVDE